MPDVAAFLGMVQSSGGLMLGLMLVVIEIRAIRRDFNRHEHGKDGRPFIRVPGVE